MDYGYARVSTKEQNEQRQIIALTQFGLSEKCIYVDNTPMIPQMIPIPAPRAEY